MKLNINSSDIMTEDSPTITVYYNAGCPICEKRMHYYQRFDSAGMVTWQDVTHDRSGLDDGITNQRIAQVLHVRDKKGDLHKGVSAYNSLWHELKNYFLLEFFTARNSIKYLFLVPLYMVFWRFHWGLTNHAHYHQQSKENK